MSYGVTGPATVSGSILTITGAGQVTITASQAGAIYAAASSVSQTIVIGQATLIITWSAPAVITYGTPLTATQLNATANVSAPSNYLPALGAIIPVGLQAFSVTFKPTDTADYKKASRRRYRSLSLRARLPSHGLLQRRYPTASR